VALSLHRETGRFPVDLLESTSRGLAQSQIGREAGCSLCVVPGSRRSGHAGLPRIFLSATERCFAKHIEKRS